MLRSFEPMLVYGLLQTETYARTVLFGSEEAATARMTRQKILHRPPPPPPSLVCLLEEVTLYKEVGGPEIVREQLEHLLALISPRLSIHIVPRDAIHPGNAEGFVIATLDDRSEVAYVNSALHGMTTGVPDGLLKMTETFKAIRNHALPVGQSIDLIKKVLEERWT